jgi:demethylmenaquinone methyltransferase/2-methoxy-6-polyprenyl-1,4-benzoquinol methylase
MMEPRSPNNAEKQNLSETVTGTRPPGVHSAAEAGSNVREMFSRIAPRYDFLNHFLSFSFDKIWRRRAALRFADILSRQNTVAMDICCGTGDLTLALERVAKQSGARVIGSDFALPMLTLAHEKARYVRRPVEFFAADALALPLADESANLVTTSFGFRNLVNYRDALAEIYRVLRPDGEVGILEFCEPRGGVSAALYRVYFTKILPRIGGTVSGDASAYAYLPASVMRFPQPEELANWMREAGFTNVRYERWTFGVLAFHRGTKP